MSLKIILQNVASYKEATELSTDKKINLVYGLNGTGKTVLSNYLYKKTQKAEESEFNDCSDNFDESASILVYNERFITDNFYEKDQIKGIFTLSSENKKALEDIKKATEELQTLSSEKEEIENQKTALEENFEEKENKTYDKIWQIKEQYAGGDRPLDYCFPGLRGNKRKLFENLFEISKPDSEPEKTMDELKNTLRSIRAGETIQSIQELEIKPFDIEKEPILQETIIGSQDSSVSQLIKEGSSQESVGKKAYKTVSNRLFRSGTEEHPVLSF